MFALKFLEPGHSTTFVGEFLKFYLVRNDSAAFSIGNGQTWLFTIFSSIAVALLLWFGPRTKAKSWALIAGLLLGGVAGNLVDRVTRSPGFPNGQVIDFLQLPFGFAIFNLADTAIVVAMSIVMIRIIRGHKIGQ
jgi:signal peptidase II